MTVLEVMMAPEQAGYGAFDMTGPTDILTIKS